ncbi:protein DpdG [Phenylobacterium sp.]|uniref:protein DpdG n=1 Tax=Phenylobacterium sp. TaxID=1871053 RepID=UPI0035683251
MKAITAVGATPHRMTILFDILAEAGEPGEEREKLAALVGPPSLARGDEPGEDNALGDCLGLGVDLGVFEAQEDRVRLAEAVRQPGLTFLDVAASRMVDQVDSAGPSSGWMAGAIAWFLCQDPLEALPWGGSGATTRIFRQLGQSDTYGMSNDSRFQQAVYWARTLGFVTRFNLKDEIVVPDPTAALLARLDRVLAPGAEATLGKFMSDLAKVCPVFDGGAVRREVADRIGLESADRAASPALALALQRAKQRGVLTFDMLNDAEVVFVPGLLDAGRVSHVARPGLAA